MLERERWGLRDRYHVHVEDRRGDAEVREWGEDLNKNS